MVRSWRGADAPLIFSAVDDVAKRLGVRPPGQIRLTYLPCCGVVAWGRSRALILGLPLLRVLTLAELRAVIAHELAHLARGDATRAAKSARFVEGLGQALERSGERARGPLGGWAKLCWRWAIRLIGPIARGQETRADRSAAAIAGGSAAASALVKVALVQPLFREVLEHYDPADVRGQPLRLLPRLLVSTPGRGAHRDAAPAPDQPERDGRPGASPPARPPRPAPVLPRSRRHRAR